MKYNESIPVYSLKNDNYLKHFEEVFYVYNHLRYSVKINLFYSEDRNLASDQLTHLVTQMVEFTYWLINLFAYKESLWKNLLHIELNINSLTEPEPIKNRKVKNFSNN